uniref:SGS domain-containing protein n=1 Tax=Steinernema glaseri TaxID=37863 RepID=A0A1I7XZ04_9BILA
MNPTAQKPRYEWFQTERAITVTVLKRGLSSSEDVQVAYADCVLKISAQGEAIFEGRLSHPVEKTRFSLQVTPRKVELQMPKTTADRWAQLLADTAEPKVRVGPMTKVDWNRLEKEVIEEEKQELKEDDGDTGMTKALRQLYQSVDPDMQRAIMKSYVESGGTVLNMNWDEVKNKKIEVSPPAGLEYRKD